MNFLHGGVSDTFVLLFHLKGEISLAIFQKTNPTICQKSDVQPHNSFISILHFAQKGDKSDILQS